MDAILRADPAHVVGGPTADRVALEFGVTLCERSLLVAGHAPGSRTAAPIEVFDPVACALIRDKVQEIIEIACLARARGVTR